MKQEIAMQWVEALESGEYKQGKLQLRKYGGKDKPNKFCCLGVLCNLHALAHPEVAATQTKPYSYLGHDLGLPPAVVAWADMGSRGRGIDGGLGEFHFDLDDAPNANSLADLNDQYGYSFQQIAEVIRQKYKDL